ncbi:hypothetical protein K461DRAFT_288297 [Myriangium duriaei CBS 260.36]|uniref:Tr-type G domain-containing protein n=1 Tax=Myriangium duriaei CBS 260.36 TaxID=1168546 RepID=A0A9P4MGE2_9PEZI|nr:hypothetical protein K461DRAFT_288297 [Myriangium duriaei CBS 260.36]
MASIFTFEPDIPRVSSPWDKQLELLNRKQKPRYEGVEALHAISRLESEPQEGPVEYKLHLLLRPRRAFSRVERVAHITTGNIARLHTPIEQNHSDAPCQTNSRAMSPMTLQSRQHRLEQLTTQLLWRLQQSSCHHTSSGSNVILPSLPEAHTELTPPPKPGKLIKGLEESQGALYEIGVADDGTFVGLSEDEMLESLNNLSAMAACLGCEVEVLRMVNVGEAEWSEESIIKAVTTSVPRKSKLVVAEALVKPILSADIEPVDDDSQLDQVVDLAGPGLHSITQTADANSSEVKSQLRVSLTGATSCGKSSLLGTLTTSALDNARGKSRLSMLKHRHEITSGLTSSVSQELIGYKETEGGLVEVVNYATENVTSWGDIHSTTHSGRLTMVSDSAGHPRYRRTAVKGLVGWAPHWTILCVPGNEEESLSLSSTPDKSDASDSTIESDLSLAYLGLCLRLHLPLVIVITKLDAASKASLRSTLGNILTLLKDSGRRPVILPAPARTAFEDDSQVLSSKAVSEATKCVSDPAFDPLTTVPIIMTSAVQGTGIEVLHALLYQLPLPALDLVDTSHPSDPLFHIEDVYTKVAETETVIVAGYLRRSHISVGDELFIGPFSLDSEDSEDSDNSRQRRPSAGPTSRSFPGALRITPGDMSARPDQPQQWRRIQVTSIRNLRLPVKTLRADQVGTIAFSARSSDARLGPDPAPPAVRVRKGMVLVRTPGTAAAYVTARFSRDDLGVLAVGSQVVVYIASVRASARVVSASVPESAPPSPTTLRSGWLGEGIASLSLDGVETNGSKDVKIPVAGAVTHEFLLVTLAFEVGREFVEVGAKVLVMPGGGPRVFSGVMGEKGGARLEGFVGCVTDVA